jgi:hypothetical protein
MGGFFLRPKDTNLVRTDAYDRLAAEAIVMADGANDRYTQRPAGEAREAKANAPLPTGNWRGPVSRTVSLKGSKK